MEQKHNIRLAVLIALGILSAIYIFYWWRIARRLHAGAPSLVQLAIGFVTNFFDTLGIGSFALTTMAYKLFGIVRDENIPGTLVVGHTLPSLALFSLLGLSVRAAFPIMASAASFAGPLAAIRFLAKQRCDLRAALGLTLGGIPGVLLAAFVVKSLPLDVLRWLVVVVIIYTAVMMLRAAYTERHETYA
jgi:uncharacterized membrane protein YfcA